MPVVAQSTEAREAIAAALNDAGLPAYAVVPKTVTLPSVIVIPDDPYLVPNRIGPDLRMEVGFVIGCLAQGNDNAAGVAVCEALAEAVIVSLPDGCRAVRVSRPSLDSLGAQGAVYVAEVTVLAQVQAAAVVPDVPDVPEPDPDGLPTPEIPPPAVPEPPSSHVDPDLLHLELDDYSGSQGSPQGGTAGPDSAVRVYFDRHLSDGLPHWCDFNLATRVPSNGAVYRDTDNLRQNGVGKPVVVDDGVDGFPVGSLLYLDAPVTAAQLADWIDAGTFVLITATDLVQVDEYTPWRPVLHITDLHTITTTP